MRDQPPPFGPAPPVPTGPSRYRPLGRRLHAARQAIPALSVVLLAAAVDVTPATIYGYEAGQHRPRRTTLLRLAAVLQLDHTELLTLAGYPVPTPAAAGSPDRRRPPR